MCVNSDVIERKEYFWRHVEVQGLRVHRDMFNSSALESRRTRVQVLRFTITLGSRSAQYVAAR